MAAILLLGVVSWVTVPRLPPGICFDDFGDIQLASATLAIAHPPGYPGYASVGYLFTRIPGVEPAYVITLACFASGLAVLVACLLWQLRFGVGVWLAIAICLGFAAHPRFWINIRAPEIYMPTLALMAWSAWFLLRYFDFGKRGTLIAAVALLGFAVANRPPVLFAVPFFLVGWVYASHKWFTRIRFADLRWILALAIVPSVYSAVFVYVRDRPDVCYNYIDLHNEEVRTLPHSSEGFGARIERVHWQLSARQFDEFKGTDWDRFRDKLRWLQTQIIYERPFTDLLALGLLAINVDPPIAEWYAHLDTYLFSLLTTVGLILAFRRCRVSGWLLSGFAIPFLVFVLIYHVFGQSADLMPVLFAQAVTLGVLGSKIVPAGGHWIRQVVAVGLAAGGALLFQAQAGGEDRVIAAHDYVAGMDIATFPGPAILCGNWTKTVPIRYAACVLTPRSDLHIVTSGPKLCMEYAATSTDRPVYVPKVPDSGGRCTAKPFRNVFRLECSTEDTTQPDPSHNGMKADQ